MEVRVKDLTAIVEKLSQRLTISIAQEGRPTRIYELDVWSVESIPLLGHGWIQVKGRVKQETEIAVYDNPKPAEKSANQQLEEFVSGIEKELAAI